MSETINVKKETFQHLLSDVECLLSDLEDLTKQELHQEALERLKDVENGNSKTINEEEFLKVLQEDGVNVR